MNVEILCVGDIHLGREPGRLPDALLAERGLDRRQLSATEAWKRTVREALTRGVAAVLLAGDVVDSDDGYLSAYTPLADGVRELIAAGIAVIAVAGNHDTEVLPRLAREIDGLRLLGPGGAWDQSLIEVDGAPALRIVGWSFPRRQVRRDPLESMSANIVRGEFGDDVGVPIIGMVHGDLGAAGGVYAPLSRVRLEATHYDAWLLGHVHKPSDLSGPRPLGYLGCLSGNDPGESGPRGPWLATLQAGVIALEQLPLAPLRWEELEIDLTDVATGEQLEERLTSSLRALDERRTQSGCAADLVGVRPILTGRSTLSANRRAEVMRRVHEDFRPRFGGASYFFDRKLQDEVRPALDLEDLARGSDPPGVLAQLLLDLEAGAASCDALVERTRQRMQEASGHANFAALERLEIDAERARQELVRSARHALEELMEQRMDAPVAEGAMSEVHA